MSSDDGGSLYISYPSLHFVAVKEENTEDLEVYSEQSSSTGPSTINYVENVVQELNYDKITLCPENLKQIKEPIVYADEYNGTGKGLDRIKGIKQEVEFNIVLTDPELSSEDKKVSLQQCSSTESITETKVKEIQEKLSYKEINLSTEIVKHLKEGLNDGTEYSGSEFNVVFSESQMDIKHNEESKNVAIGLQECLERPKSPLQCSSRSAKFQRDRNSKVEWDEICGEMALSCRICRENFTQNSQLREHMRGHLRGKDWECNYCGAKFKRAESLRIHYRIHTGDSPYKCEICGFKFRVKNQLKRHIGTHTGERPFTCETCGSQFTDKTTLRRHVATHTGEKPFSCKICGSKFTDNYMLKKHMVIHTGEKAFNCKICASKFTVKCTLERHMTIHTGEKPFNCEICGSNFRGKEKLRTHMRIHTRENPFNCEICGSRFIEKTNLIRHMVIHSDEKPFACEICRRKFKVKDTLKTHMRIHAR